MGAGKGRGPTGSEPKLLGTGRWACRHRNQRSPDLPSPKRGLVTRTRNRPLHRHAPRQPIDVYALLHVSRRKVCDGQSVGGSVGCEETRPVGAQADTPGAAANAVDRNRTCLRDAMSMMATDPPRPVDT